jgi:hypothetical protein
MTPWQEQQAVMLDGISKKHAEPAKRAWIALRDALFADLATEQRTKRQVLDSLRRKYEALRAAYLRITGATYDGWGKHGPQPEWDEVIAAAHDDAVWDRLVERCLRERAEAIAKVHP